TPPITGSTSTQVVHGPAARLTLQGIPSSTVAGNLLVATVTAVDRHGNVVTDFAGTIHFASTDPKAQLPADFVFTAAYLGSRPFPGVLVASATWRVTGSSAGLDPDITTVM